MTVIMRGGRAEKQGNQDEFAEGQEFTFLWRLYTYTFDSWGRNVHEWIMRTRMVLGNRYIDGPVAHVGHSRPLDAPALPPLFVITRVPGVSC